MHIEGYNLESLRKLVRSLQKENEGLKGILKNAGIPFQESSYFEDIFDESDAYDPDRSVRNSDTDSWLDSIKDGKG